MYTPRKVFILENGGYLELTYEAHCARCENDPSYQGKRFLPLHGMLMEVSEEDYTAFYKDKRRQKYLMEQSAGHRDVSMDAVLADDFRGEDSLKDPAQDVVEQVERILMTDKLRKCLPLLAEEEQELLHALFYQRKSEREWSAETGIPQKTINDRKRRILGKLKKFLET